MQYLVILDRVITAPHYNTIIVVVGHCHSSPSMINWHIARCCEMQEYFKFTRIYFDTAFDLIWLEDFDEKNIHCQDWCFYSYSPWLGQKNIADVWWCLVTECYCKRYIIWINIDLSSMGFAGTYQGLICKCSRYQFVKWVWNIHC